ncbi:MAG: GNAT family N-acetyltransferase [Planctomycetes bacterium]|nr:GNAT family N-acetyltransferase [Planctomycetota bacterium]
MSSDIRYQITTIDRIRPLRHRELRAGLPFESAIFEGDDLPTTLHFGAFIENENVGCATFMAQPWNGQPAMRLRGMATRADMRSRGIGAGLLRFAERTLIAREGPRQLWCDARIGAIRFYEANGWAIASELFEVPTAGPHYKMTRMLE